MPTITNGLLKSRKNFFHGEPQGESMTRSPFRRNVALGALIAAVSGGCAGPLLPPTSSELQPTFPGDAHGDQNAGPLVESAKHSASGSARAPGMVVHIDPNSGQIVTPPVESQKAEILQQSSRAIQKPRPQLYQTLSAEPGGGIVIELDDRFLTPLTATMDGDGKVRLEHLPAGSRPGGQE
jgi:hypothetical protein